MSKRTIGIISLVGGVLLVGLLYILILRGVLRERDRQSILGAQIEPLEMALANQQEEAQELPTRQAELVAIEAEQATVQAELMTARLAFPSEVDSTEVLAHVVAAAAINNANLRQLQARDPITATIDELAYLIFAYDVRAEGELDDLSAFLTDLESGPVGTLSLDQIRIEVLPTPGATSIAPPAEGPVIYQASLVVQVQVRMADPGTSPLPPVGTPVSPEERARQLETLLEQARQAEDWERAISLLLVLRQIRPSDPVLEAQLVEAYVREGQRRLAAGQYDQAGADFGAALDLQPYNYEAQEGLAVLQALTPTPVPIPTITLTGTPTPSPTCTPTETPTPSPTVTPTITPTPMPYYVLHLSLGSNTRYPDLGCAWFGFAGKVTDAVGYPLGGIRVHVWSPGWDGFWTTTLPSGEYEQYLDDHPRQEQWLVQLYEGNVAVSAVITVQSRADCDSSVIHMDWRRGY
jgi:tetratricopeptide (TPR) repeat protein